MKPEKDRVEGRLVAYVVPRIKQQIEAAARRMGVSASTVVVLALQAFLKRPQGSWR